MAIASTFPCLPALARITYVACGLAALAGLPWQAARGQARAALAGGEANAFACLPGLRVKMPGSLRLPGPSVAVQPCLCLFLCLSLSA